MHLALTVSLDPLADSLIDALSAQSDEPWPRSQRRGAMFLRFGAREWLGEGNVDSPACLDALGEMILDRLGQRPVNSVDIDFLLYGNDRRASELFLPVYRYFERFLKVITTRRLHVIYPRKAKLLAEFGANLSEIQEDAACAKYELAELGFVLEPDAPTQWPRDQVRAWGMLGAMAGSRERLDEVLTGAVRRCCNSSYSACVYDIAVWQRYFILRGTVDLTARRAISRNREVTAQAERFLATTQVIADESRIRYSDAEIGSLNTAHSIAHAPVDQPVNAQLASSADRQKRLCRQIESSEHTRVEDLAETYRKELVRGFDRDRGSLDSFEQAVCLHHTILEILDSPSQHREFFLKVVEPSLDRLAEDLIGFAASLSDAGAVEQRADSETGLGEKLAQLAGLLGDLPWSEISICLRPAALGLLSFARRLFQITSCVVRDANTPDPDAAAALAKPFGDLLQDHLLNALAGVDMQRIARNLDEALERLKGHYLARQRDLRRLMSEYRFFRRMIRYGEYKALRDPIRRDLADTERRYQQWRIVAAACCRLAGRLLFLQSHVRLVQRLFARRRQQIETTGQFLVDFASALTARNKEVADALDGIGEDPEVRDEVELLFLAKPQMEALYRRFGPVRQDKYIESLLGQSEVSWGVWALRNLGDYLANVPDHCAGCFLATPKLDLPSLMFEHFPEERVARIKRAVELVTSRLIPLTSEHLHDRKYHMMLGFPQIHLERLANDESEFAIDNRRVSLNPTGVAYVDNADPNVLDLTVSACGFRIEDYLYWGVFEGT